MKILIVGSSLFDWGGIERYVTYMAEGLAERGHEVVTMAPPESPLLQRTFGPTISLANRGRLRPAVIAKLIREFRSGGYDFVNVHFSPDFLAVGIAGRLVRKPKLVLTRHVALRWRPAKARRYTRLYDGFFGVSEAVRKHLVACGIPPERTQVPYAGCHALEPTITREEARKQLGIESFAVGFFGRLVTDKGTDLFPGLARGMPPGSLHVFGDGPERKAVEAIPGLCYHGRVTEVADAMAAMDAIWMPSQWEEALGFVPMEAASLGLPVVVSRTGGLPELVKDGETGFICEKADLEGYMAAFRRLAEDADLRTAMGTRAKLLHSGEFTVAHMAERLESAFVKIVPQR